MGEESLQLQLIHQQELVVVPPTISPLDMDSRLHTAHKSGLIPLLQVHILQQKLHAMVVAVMAARAGDTGVEFCSGCCTELRKRLCGLLAGSDACFHARGVTAGGTFDLIDLWPFHK